jgi:hypothetical protein
VGDASAGVGSRVIVASVSVTCPGEVVVAHPATRTTKRTESPRALLPALGTTSGLRDDESRTSPATKGTLLDMTSVDLSRSMTNLSSVLCNKHVDAKMKRTNHFAPHRLLIAALAVIAALVPAAASASAPVELPSVLVISKSSNRNQVHYAALLNEACSPVSQAPLRPYWRMLERGPFATEPVSASEQRWLGLERQSVGDDAVSMSLRAMPNRVFTVHTGRSTDGRCSSWVEATISGVPAHVASIYVKQKFFGVDYVLLTGWTRDGSQVSERISL